VLQETALGVSMDGRGVLRRINNQTLFKSTVLKGFFLGPIRRARCISILTAIALGGVDMTKLVRENSISNMNNGRILHR
jgi:hypothetical protein